MERAVILQKFLFQRRRKNVPLYEAVFDEVAQIIGHAGQLFGAVGRAGLQQRHQIPAQFRGAQAEFAFVRIKRLVFIDFYENARANCRRPVGQEISTFPGSHGEQAAEKSHGR